MKAKPRRPRYPRIECHIAGCSRGTTTFPPDTIMVCGRCWRKAPQQLRKRWSNMRRRRTLAEKRGDMDTAERADRVCSRLFWRIVDLLNGPAEPGEGIDPLMAEQLRKDGLL